MSNADAWTLGYFSPEAHPRVDSHVHKSERSPGSIVNVLNFVPAQ